MGVIVRQKVKGKGKPWWVFVTHDGQRTSKKVGDKKAADRVASAIREKLSKGEFNIGPPKKMPTFGEYSEKWVEGYIKTMRRMSTYGRYRQLLNSYILRRFQETNLDKISRGDIRDFLVSMMQAGMSRSSICVLRDVISGVFNYAIDEEIIPSNPVNGITKRLELKRQKKEIDPLSAEELSLFLETCRSDFQEFYPFFFMGARTGMRLGELLAVRWDDIDFNSGFIWVKRSYRRGRMTSPKNKKTRRLDISDQLAAVLRELLTKEKKEALKQGRGETPELVFHKDGRIMEQNYLRRIFARILKKAQMRVIRIHDLRHTFASLLLSNGKSPVYVKEQLGHSSIQITVDIYGHWIQSQKETGVNILDDIAPVCTPSAPKSEKSRLSACIS